MDSEDLQIAFFQRELLIDKHRLDDELLKQVDLHPKITEAYSEAVEQRDNAEVQVKRLKGQKFLQYKQAPGGSETAIKSLVDSDDDVQRAYTLWYRLAARAETLSGLKETSGQRPYLLDEAASLYLSGYYQRSSTSAGATTSASSQEYEANKRKMQEARNSMAVGRPRLAVSVEQE